MSLTQKDVEHVARLARLALTDEEKNKFTQQLGNILQHVDKLGNLNTDNIVVTAHPFFSETAWREDVAVESGKLEALLKNAPEREENFFKVKKVIE